MPRNKRKASSIRTLSVRPQTTETESFGLDLFHDLWVPIPPYSKPRRNTLTTTSHPQQEPPLRQQQQGQQHSPQQQTTPPSELLLPILLKRFQAIHVRVVALTHTVYGTPSLAHDSVEQIFPSAWIQNWGTHGTTPILSQRKRKRGEGMIQQPQPQQPQQSQSSVRILTRLHAVVENVSDVSYYTYLPENSPNGVNDPRRQQQREKEARLLRGYDLVSIAPRNDAVFEAVCQATDATHANSNPLSRSSYTSSSSSSFSFSASPIPAYQIITLDYSSDTIRRGRLPFRLPRNLVQVAARRNNVVFEIPYAPAILHGQYRRAFVQTLRELQMAASVGMNSRTSTSSCSSSSSSRSSSSNDKVRMVLSSGPRIGGGGGGGGIGHDGEENDLGVLALRMPGDLVNLLEVLLKWRHDQAASTVSKHSAWTVQTAQRRRMGGSSSVVEIEAVDRFENDEEMYRMDATASEVSTASTPMFTPISQLSRVCGKTVVKGDNNNNIAATFDYKSDFANSPTGEVDYEDGFISL